MPLLRDGITASAIVTSFDEVVGLGTVDVDGVMLGFHCVAIADGSRVIDVGAAVRVTLGRRFGALEALSVATQD